MSAIGRYIVLDDGETFGALDGALLIEVDESQDAIFDALEDGDGKALVAMAYSRITISEALATEYELEHRYDDTDQRS